MRNPDLEATYPYWAPLIDDEAEDPSVFGPVHERAVEAFQTQAGLPESGFVDETTLESMRLPRCGHPENELALKDPSEKWDFMDTQQLLTGSPVSWFVKGCFDNGTNFCETLKANFDAGPTGDSSSVEARAFGVWANETNKTFNRLSSCVEPCIAGIEFMYYSDADKANNLALNSWPMFGNTDDPGVPARGGRGTSGNYIVAVNSASPGWTVDKLRGALLHEIGHVLNLNHSSTGPGAPTGTPLSSPSVAAFTACGSATLPCTNTTVTPPNTANPAVMFFLGSASQQLTVDDRLGARTVWGTCKALNGLATDIGVGGSFVTSSTPVSVKNPDVWVTSGNATVWKMKSDATGFIQDTNANASGIAISVTPSGIPWTVAAGGQVRSRSSASCTGNTCPGSWTPRGTIPARDIGIGGASDTSCVDGSAHPCVWIVTTTPSGSDFVVRRWDGTSFVTPAQPMTGVRIAVSALGRPLVVKSDGRIFTNVSTGGLNTWTQLTGAAPGPTGCARDIGAGRIITGCVTGSSGNEDVWSLAENLANIPAQGGIDPMTNRPITNNRNMWITMDGAAERVAMGPEGRAYAVQVGGGIFRADAK